jgi:CubicO group peptidase (beta-lactamase class C family)
MKKIFTFIMFVLVVAIVTSCSKSNNPAPSNPITVTSTTLYFPPATGTWSTTTAASLGWNTSGLSDLNTYLQSVGTKAFIILKNGKIVTEQYYGTFTADSVWYWDSAGKTVTGFLVGIAQTQNLVNINNSVSSYIGAGWTSETPTQENAITVKNLLSMTSGLNDDIQPNNYSTLPSSLTYLAPADTRWAYHTGAYTVLDSVLERTSGLSFNAYFQQNLASKVGMTGLWYKVPNANNIYYSNARSMARFGLLMLNKGTWDNQVILSDTNYFHAQVNTSQTYNLSYGYLTWLNGKASEMLPGYQTVVAGDVIPNGPNDMYMALGKNDQKVYVIPSQNLVVIRMGNSAGGVSLAVSDFDNTLWGKLKAIIGYTN